MNPTIWSEMEHPTLYASGQGNLQGGLNILSLPPGSSQLILRSFTETFVCLLLHGDFLLLLTC